MGWVKLSDDAIDHRKLKRIGLDGIGLWVAGLSYCARFCTDGHIPREELDMLYGGRDSHDLDKVVAKLVKAGLWVEDGDDLVIHDYLDYQPSAKQESERKAKDRERKAKGRESKDSRRSPQPVRADSTRNPDGVRSESGRPEPEPEPDPSPSLRSGGDARMRATPTPSAPPPGSEAWVGQLHRARVEAHRPTVLRPDPPAYTDTLADVVADLERLYAKGPGALAAACESHLASGFRWGQGRAGPALKYLRGCFDSALTPGPAAVPQGVVPRQKVCGSPPPDIPVVWLEDEDDEGEAA